MSAKDLYDFFSTEKGFSKTLSFPKQKSEREYLLYLLDGVTEMKEKHGDIERFVDWGNFLVTHEKTKNMLTDDERLKYTNLKKKDKGYCDCDGSFNRWHGPPVYYNLIFSINKKFYRTNNKK